jgi:2-C-methyl-D-erythritol 4-phosphate cytidylyltransferase
MKRIGLVLLAGGSGKRMGTTLAKQFIHIQNKSILQHCIDRFYSWNKRLEVVVVLPENDIDYWISIRENKHLNYILCKGGKERFHSVKNGLEAIKNVDYVMIHDGVRPFVSNDVLDRCIQSLEKNKGVIPVLSPTESIRMLNENGSEHLDRSEIRLVQTPQCFHFNAIKEAYNNEYKLSFTDDASVFEKDGNIVDLVEGNDENIKITKPSDLKWAEVYLGSHEKN